MCQEKRGPDRGDGRRRQRATTANALANEEAVQPGDARASATGRRQRRLQLDCVGHKGLLPETEHAVRRVPAGGEAGRQPVQRRQVPVDRSDRRTSQGVRGGPRQRRVRAVPDGVVPERPG